MPIEKLQDLYAVTCEATPNFIVTTQSHLPVLRRSSAF